MNITIQPTELSNRVQIDEDELLFDDLELAELVAKILSHLQMQRPVAAVHPSLRSVLTTCYGTLSVYLRAPAELAIVDDRAQGIIWAVPNALTNRIEFRVLDLDPETFDVIGSRIFAAEPAMAACWLKSMVCATSGSLPFDSLIEIREALSDRIKSRISGDSMVEQINSFVTNAHAALAARNQAPALKAQLLALTDSDYDKLEAFCAKHPQLNLEPHRMLKVAIELEQLRTAAMAMVVKLSNDLFNSLNTQDFAVSAKVHTGLSAVMPTRQTVASLSHKSTRLFSDALSTIETSIKAKLMAETMVNVRMARVDTEYSARQITELVLAIAENHIDTRSMFTLDETAVKNLNFAADEWWRLVMVETLHDNGLIACVVSGKDAGRARQYDGTQKHWYPLKQRQLR